MTKFRHLRPKLLSVALAAMLAPLGACASSPALVGPRPAPDAQVGETVSGSACGILVLGFIPAKTNSRTERAYADALGARAGKLTDTAIKYSWYVIPGVGLMLCTEVQGRVVS